MEVNFPTDHILYRSLQWYRQTTIQLPHFIHIQQVIMVKNQCISSQSCKTFSFGQVGKMSFKMCTFCTEKHSTQIISEGNQMQKQHMGMSLLQKGVVCRAYLFFLKTKISQTRHVVDSKSNLNSQGQVMTKHYASLPEFLSIKNIKTINASTNHLHPHVCIHYHTPNKKTTAHHYFWRASAASNSCWRYALPLRGEFAKKVCLALTNSMIQAFFN